MTTELLPVAAEAQQAAAVAELHQLATAVEHSWPGAILAQR
jgi:hypothetical protein